MLLWRELVTIDRHAPIAAGPGGRHGWATTTARRSCGCSASTSSGRSWSGCRRWRARRRRRPGTCCARRIEAGPDARGPGGRPDAIGPAAAARATGAACSCRSTSGRSAAAPRQRRRRDAGRAARRVDVARPATRGAAWRRVLADPETVERLGSRRTTSRRGSRPSRSSRVGVGVRRRPHPRRGSLLGFAVPGTDGRVVAADAEDGTCAGGGRDRRGQAARRATTSSRCWSGSCRRRDPTATTSLSRQRRLAAARRLRHPDRGVHPQRGACAASRSRTSAPSGWTRSCRAPGSCAARTRRPSRRSPRPPRASRWPRSWTEEPGAAARPRRAGAAAHPGARGPGGDRASPSTAPPWASSPRTFADGDRPAGGGHLRVGRPPVHARQPQAARAGAVLRAEPAARQAHQDRLLHRRVRAGGPAPGAPDGRHAARLAAVHEAALHLHRGAAAAAGTRPRGRLHTTFQQAVAATGRLSQHGPEPPEHPHPDGARPAHPPCVRGGRPRPRAAGRGLLPDRAARPGPRVAATCTSRRRSRGARTSTARPRPGCSRRTPRTSPRTSARWPRWSTSGWPTA